MLLPEVPSHGLARIPHPLPDLPVEWLSGAVARATVLPAWPGALDAVRIDILLEGRARALGAGRCRVPLGAGQALVRAHTVAGCVVLPPSVRVVSLAIPAAALISARTAAGRSLQGVVPGRCEALRLLTDYLRLLPRGDPPDALRLLAAAHVRELAAVVVDAARELPPGAASWRRQAAQLRAVKADIRAHLVQRDLTMEALARRQGLSVRALRTLFQGEGTTFARHVQAGRLARVHALLSDPASAARAIGAIAADAGFGDLSHFNQAFLRHYGRTPSQVRAAARSAGT
jgi:AraC-like DNA-binding protein